MCARTRMYTAIPAHSTAPALPAKIKNSHIIRTML
jgi:hypothetical protein